LKKVVEIEEMATRCGFTLADMRAFDTAITPEKIASIRRAALQRRNAAPSGSFERGSYVEAP
jgi:hypothetical protein